MRALLALVLAASVTVSAAEEASFRPGHEPATGVWAAQDFKKLGEARLVAEHDAYRKLAERLYGAALTSEDITRDKQAVQALIATSVSDIRLNGVTVAAERAFPDGRYEVDVVIGWEEAIKVVKKTVASKGASTSRFESKETTTSVKRKLTATGYGGLVGSDGWRKAVAVRAGELDVQKKLAQRLGATLLEAYGEGSLNSLVSEGVATSVAATVMGATYGKVNFVPSGASWVANVEASISKGQVVETLKTHAMTTPNGTSKATTSTIETKDLATFSETGIGSDSDWEALAAKTEGGEGGDLIRTEVTRILSEIIIVK